MMNLVPTMLTLLAITSTPAPIAGNGTTLCLRNRKWQLMSQLTLLPVPAKIQIIHQTHLCLLNKNADIVNSKCSPVMDCVHVKKTRKENYACFFKECNIEIWCTILKRKENSSLEKNWDSLWLCFKNRVMYIINKKIWKKRLTASLPCVWVCDQSSKC
jgi:hypothetical protein